jgi:hypothetical protein
MKYFILMISIVISATAFAGEGNGKITGFIPYANGNKEIILIKVEQHTSSPSCNSTLRFSMREDNLKYQGTKAAALAAFMAGTPVKILGENNCRAWGNAESIMFR